MSRARGLTTFASILAATLIAVAGSASADQLDDVINSGKLRCGIMLDFPPLGSRDANNEPIGYDVDWCHDMAKALGVEPVIVETPSPERIPALIAGRVDISISGASNTVERAKTVLFSIPYNNWPFYALTRADTGIKTFDDFKGKRIGGVRGTTPEIYTLEYFDQWKESKDNYISYSSDADLALALHEQKIDGFVTILDNAERLKKKYSEFALAGPAPFPSDVNAMMVRRGEFGWLHWVNLFIYQQVRMGRFAELYKKWIAQEVPSLALQNVYY